MSLRDMAAITSPTMAPKTAAAKFTVTPKDVGSEAVRAGVMADLEERCHTLLVAAKLVQQRAKNGKAKLDALSEHALQAAVAIAESEV